METSPMAEGVEPLGKKPGPAGNAVALCQSNGRDTAMDFRDIAARWCIEVWLYSRTEATLGALVHALILMPFHRARCEIPCSGDLPSPLHAYLHTRPTRVFETWRYDQGVDGRITPSIGPSYEIRNQSLVVLQRGLDLLDSESKKTRRCGRSAQVRQFGWPEWIA
jgi:hypothetical protein